MTALLVALGALAGAPLRYVVGHYLDRRMPWGTVLVNLLGSFLLGLFTGLGLSGDDMALLGTGFCGAFTTYSAFAVQTHALATEPRQPAPAPALFNSRGNSLLNVLVTVPPALVLCALGFLLPP